MARSNIQSRRKWIIEVDYLKGFAILAVVAIHTSTNSIQSVSTLNTLISANVVIDVFSHFAVPLFVMLSGFILAYKYKRVDPLRSYYEKRIKAILPPYLVFSILYLLLAVIQGSSLTLRRVVYGIATASSASHLWFIALILQLYLLYPFLINVYHRLKSKGTIIFLMSAWLIQMLWIILRIVVLNSAPFQAPYLLDRFFASYIFYFAIGIVIGMRFELLQSVTFFKSKFVWLAVALTAVLTAVISLSWINGLIIYGSYSNTPARHFLIPVLLEPLLYLSTSWVLLRISNYLVQNRNLASQVLNQLGRYSLGVYLIHYFYLIVLKILLGLVGITSSDWAFYPMIFITQVILSIATVKLLSFLPYNEFVIGEGFRQPGRQQVTREPAGE